MTQFPLPLAFDQDRLSQICPDRDLQTCEFHEPNDYYGQASVLKRYVGLPDESVLKGVLEHGVIIDDRIWSYDRDQKLAWILASSTNRAAQLKSLSGKHAESIGFGFLYARALVERTWPTPNGASRRGTLVFPCHSTHTVTAKYDHEEYAKRLRTLADSVQPVCVCLYWRNFEFGHHEIYRQQGIPVFSAGHMFDRNFMLRFYDLCRHFQYAASNVIGTHYFQAIASGCRFFHVPSGEIDWDVPDLEREGVERGSPLGAYEEAIHSSSLVKWDAIDWPTQQRVAGEVLGEDCFRTPEQLREVLRQAEWADKLSWTKVRMGDSLVPAPPAYVRRRLRFAAKIGRSIRKRLPWTKAA